MENRSDRLDLTLNTQEVIVLFFVMVALFTGLLFFGYRVGYMHSASAADTQSRPLTPAAPADEGPSAEPNSREVEIEPEIRLENRPWSPGYGPAIAPELGDPGVETGRLLAGETGERPVGCQAESYLSFLWQTVPAKHRLFGRLADWAGVSTDRSSQSDENPAEARQPATAAGSDTHPEQPEPPHQTDCGRPMDQRVLRSVVC